MFTRLNRLGRLKYAVMILLAALIAFGSFFMDRTHDPVVDYYGVLVRKSDLRTLAQGPLYCQGLAAFSFGPTFACFDTMQELDTFAATR